MPFVIIFEAFLPTIKDIAPALHEAQLEMASLRREIVRPT
jgi:hypothetical protein